MRFNTFFGFDIDKAKDENPHLRFRALQDGRSYIVTETKVETRAAPDAQAAPRLPNMSGRKPRELGCMSCDAKITGATQARRIGWIVSKYGRNCTCPACDRANAVTRRQSQ